jgi:uncharacterized protein (TIGR03435 family)
MPVANILRDVAAVFLFLPTIPAFSQPPSFEVADVKVNKSGEARMAVAMQPGGKLIMHNVPMKVMLMFAYHVRGDALTGGPAWLESDRFDIVAKAAERASPDDTRRMLQTLLAERFNLVVHTDQKVMQAYALTVAKAGPKLQPAEEGLLSEQGCRPTEGRSGEKHIACKHTTMALLADSLQEMAPRDFPVPIVDQTALAGSYNFKLDWTPTAKAADAAPPTDMPVGPTIFDAVESQLGLKLENRKLPLPVIVIDRVTRVPTDN